MFEYTENNHYKFGYQRVGDLNPYWFENRISKHDTFIVDYGCCSYEPKSFKEECLMAAKKINKSTNLTPNILFSGGLDSEIVVESFRLAKIPFKVSILRFNDDLNLHDIAYAVIYCNLHNIEYDFINLDVIKFWEYEMHQIVDNAQCISTMIATVLWLMNQIDGLPILGSGEGTFRVNSLKWYHPFGEVYSSYFKHLIIQQKEGIPSFYRYTPELMYSFCNEPIFNDLTNNLIPGKVVSTTLKYSIFSKYFDVISRPNYHGYEKFLTIENQYFQKLKKDKSYNQTYEIEYNNFLRKMKYK